MINMKLVLKENNPKNYVVVDLDNGISFVHDNNTGKNWFNQEAISRITGLTQGRISQGISQYNDEMGNITNSNIALNVLNSTKTVKFYDFDIVTYIVYRSNSLKARQMRKYIADSIDEKFNKDAGFTKTIEPTHEDKILSRAKKQQAKIRMRSDALYTELNFMNPNPERAKEILEEINELKPEELRINRQIKNIENCFGSLSRETSARSQSKLSDFGNNSKIEKSENGEVVIDNLN